MINLKIKTNGTVRNLTLPYPGQSIPDIIEKNSVVTVSEVTEPESLKYMEGHEWNIDEINFLAKRMESFDKREKRQFDAIASQLKPSTGQDLINQTFNLSRYTLISDFSSLTEIGKTHIINRKQATSAIRRLINRFGKENLTINLVLAYPKADMDMLEEQYDSVIIPPSLNHVHPKAAIKERNRWMVENCNLLIAYVTHDHGGAATALRMAEKQGVEVFRI